MFPQKLELCVCFGHNILVIWLSLKETDDIFCYILEHNKNYSIAKFTFYFLPEAVGPPSAGVGIMGIMYTTYITGIKS